MKKAAFFLFVILSFYIAGLYRYPPLLVLSTGEILLLPLLFGLTRYFRRHISLEPARKSETAEKEREIDCELRVRNSGKLPISRFGVRVSAWYGVSRMHRYRTVLFGGCEQGENVLHFSIVAGHCGLMRISLDRIRVYDYLSLFSAGKRLDTEMTAAVFPGPGALQIRPAGTGRGYSDREQRQNSAGAGDSHDEVRQIREYRIGDLGRDIHWNQSARTDMLWVREYERETEETAELYLLPAQSRADENREIRRKKREEAFLERQDAFYELLSALILGLLKLGIWVRVHWSAADRPGAGDGGTGDGGTGIQGRDAGFLVRDPESCREMLLLLYRSKIQDGPAGDGSPEGISGRGGAGSFCLTGDLGLYREGRLLYRFSVQGLEQEMEEKTFFL